MSKKTTTTAPKVISYEDSLIIEALRKLALQRDTKAKYAEEEEEAEGYQSDIVVIRHMLATLGDTKTLVLKSERKPKAKKVAKPKAKAKGVKIAKVAKAEEALATA